jgi:hypothetical protein
MAGVDLLKGVVYHKETTTGRDAQSDPSVLCLAMLIIIQGGSPWITKHRGPLLETDAMLAPVLSGFLRVPL